MGAQTKYTGKASGEGLSLRASNGRKPSRAKIKRQPDFALERAAQVELGDAALIVGVDEVGRGPLAGPVVAAAAWLSEAAAAQLASAGLKDSKAMSEARREDLATQLRALCAKGAAKAALGAASAREIDALNIRNATFLAMRRALARLSANANAPIALALIDGNAVPPGVGPAEPIVKGDGRSLSIAAAAVLAKTVRDKAMRRLDLRWPEYGWASNAGYPTAVHRAALVDQGPSPHHRRSFGGVAARGE